MHAFGLVIVSASPHEIEREVRRRLARFERREVEPYKAYVDPASFTRRQWQSARTSEDFGRDEAGYYWLDTHAPEGRWDYWLVGGAWDGVLTGAPRDPSGQSWARNTRSVASLLSGEAPPLDALEVAVVVTPDGGWHEVVSPGAAVWTVALARERDTCVRSLLERHAERTVVGVDLHL